MDAVHSLLRTVARGFYDVRAVIILDTLLVHHVLSDRELVTATGISARDVRALCARMREDHILTEVQHKDGGMGGMRAFTQTVYYIHFTEAVDAVKWKMHAVEQMLRDELDHKHNAQDYTCDVCGAKYETMDALTLFDAASQQFLCATCNSPLREAASPAEAAPGDNQMEDLMRQLQPLIAQLKRIDEVTIPENTFESELEQHIPLIGADSATSTAFLFPQSQAHQGERAQEKDLTIAGSASSRLPQQVQSTVQVHITSAAEERSLQESALAEKQRLSRENALPEWHAHSTIGAAAGEPRAESAGAAPAAEEPPQAQTDAQAASKMEEYFRRLQQTQQAEDDGEDEDEDEFEDVV